MVLCFSIDRLYACSCCCFSCCDCCWWFITDLLHLSWKANRQIICSQMDRTEYRQMIDDEQEEHTIGSLDTSMDRYLEHHQLWRKRIPQGTIIEFSQISSNEFSLLRRIKFISCCFGRCKFRFDYRFCRSILFSSSYSQLKSITMMFDWNVLNICNCMLKNSVQ